VLCGLLIFFLMPSFIRYSNEKLGFNDNVIIEKNININININNDNDNNDNNNNAQSTQNGKEMQTINLDNNNTSNTNNTNNNNAIISNVKINNEVKHIQYNSEVEYQRALYTTCLYWCPLMGIIGLYYVYLGKYKQFFLRFFYFEFFPHWLDY